MIAHSHVPHTYCIGYGVSPNDMITKKTKDETCQSPSGRYWGFVFKKNLTIILKPNIWWILAKIRSFLVLETFQKQKKNLQNDLKPPSRPGGFKLKILKPPWNHFGFTKKDNFPKSALKSYFDVSKNIIFLKIRIQIF